MATAKLSDIAGHVRRITGSADVPLNTQGKQQADELAGAVAGKFDKVYSSPMKRAIETARKIDPAAKSVPWLGPWKLGVHEGKPSETEKATVNNRILKRPYVPTGDSEHSKERGESFDQFRRRVIGGLQTQQETLKPGETVLNVTHGRNLRLVHSWLKNGAKADGSIDKSEMTKDGEWSDTGALFHMERKNLVPVDDATKPGIYFARHGETNWNATATPKTEAIQK